MMITKDKDVAIASEKVGVSRIFVDLEKNGKAQRQPGDTVKSDHTIEDVKEISKVLTESSLLVRINPIFHGSKSEIEQVLECNPDYVMLPFFKTYEEVSQFINFVEGRAKTILLFETKESIERIDEILSIDGIDEAYIGLNDLHMSYGKEFMFELLVDGTVSEITKKFKAHGLPFGFGGIGNINGKAAVSPEKILCAHYYFESQSVILSRTFSNNKKLDIPLEQYLTLEIEKIRKYEAIFSNFTLEEFEDNQKQLAEEVSKFVRGKLK
ncbi:aldolase/citrate lyase family protein [Enterococcus sp.]|uniref:aldolase/citrate lyase family protein n=1 Tax=Enterococcus sp. TaxID=35783 RepID=UPI0028A0905B|nr:aldolase/citrate lyase family protein [Enterococcus sp.]